MESKYMSFISNGTWSLVPLPPGRKAISACWIYRKKPGPHGVGICYKARLVAIGFQQKPDIDYTETFASVVKWETIRLIAGLAA
jgi:hypothetical protein